MHKALIVANRTVGGDQLAAEIKRRVNDDQCEFHLVVPVASPVAAAVAVGEGAANMGPSSTYEVRDERQIASDQLTYGIDWLKSLGATVTGELSTECDTAAAVTRIVTESGADEVIVSTLPSTISRWLHQDLPHRIGRKIKVPVTVITGSC